MRIAKPLTTILATFALSLSVAACGGGGDDGDDDPDITLDAAPTIDAPPMIDAAPENTSTKLGKLCMADTDCPPEAPTCVTYNGVDGQCTLECGTSTAADMPPQGGNTTCAAQYDGTSGTPFCVGNDAMGTPPVCPDGTCTWVCGVVCGEFQGMQFGDCPNGLTCASNVCGG